MPKSVKKSLIVIYSILSAFLTYIPLVSAQTTTDIFGPMYQSLTLVFGIIQDIVKALLDSLQGNAILAKGLLAIIMGIIFYSELKEVKVFKNKSGAAGLISFLVSISIAYWLPETLTKNIFSATNPFIGFILCCFILLLSKGDSNWSTFGKIISYLGLMISFGGLMQNISGTIPVTIVGGFMVASLVALIHSIGKLKGGGGKGGGAASSAFNWWRKRKTKNKRWYKPWTWGREEDTTIPGAGHGEGGLNITDTRVNQLIDKMEEALQRSQQANRSGQNLVSDAIRNAERIEVEIKNLPAVINHLQEQYARGEPVDKININYAQNWVEQNRRFNDNYSKISNYLSQIHSYLFKNGQEIDNILNAVKTISPENQKRINDLKEARRKEHSKLIELGNTQENDYKKIMDYGNMLSKLLQQTKENINNNKYDDARKNAEEAIKVNGSIEQVLADIGMVLKKLEEIDVTIKNTDIEIRRIFAEEQNLQTKAEQQQKTGAIGEIRQTEQDGKAILRSYGPEFINWVKSEKNKGDKKINFGYLWFINYLTSFKKHGRNTEEIISSLGITRDDLIEIANEIRERGTR